MMNINIRQGAGPRDDFRYFTVRTRRILKDEGYHSVLDLMELTELELRKVPGLGPKGCREVVVFLERVGIRLRSGL